MNDWLCCTVNYTMFPPTYSRLELLYSGQKMWTLYSAMNSKAGDGYDSFDRCA